MSSWTESLKVGLHLTQTVLWEQRLREMRVKFTEDMKAAGVPHGSLLGYSLDVTFPRNINTLALHRGPISWTSISRKLIIKMCARLRVLEREMAKYRGNIILSLNVRSGWKDEVFEGQPALLKDRYCYDLLISLESSTIPFNLFSPAAWCQTPLFSFHQLHTWWFNPVRLAKLMYFQRTINDLFLFSDVEN